MKGNDRPGHMLEIVVDTAVSQVDAMIQADRW